MNKDIRREDEEVIVYLKHYANLENYYLHEIASTDSCLINYFDDKGQGWSLMEDDDAFAERCVNFLKKLGTPLFDDIEEMKAFESEKSLAIRNHKGQNN